MKQSIRFSIKTSIPDITNSTLGGDVLEAKQQELFFSELRGIRDKVSQLQYSQMVTMTLQTRN